MHKILFILFFFLFVFACSDDDVREPWPREYYTDVLLPDISITDGGVQSSPAANGLPYYFNSQHTAEESDVRMGTNVYGFQTVKRYLWVNGTAVPDDSGYTDRYYHSVTFYIYGSDMTNYMQITLPVDTDNRFEGYLYFGKTGTNYVYAFRATNNTLLPR